MKNIFNFAYKDTKNFLIMQEHGADFNKIIEEK